MLVTAAGLSEVLTLFVLAGITLRGRGDDAIGLGYGILNRSGYAVVVFLSVATNLIAPALINFASRSAIRKQASASLQVIRIG